MDQKGPPHHLVNVVDVAVGAQADCDAVIEQFRYRSYPTAYFAVGQGHVAAPDTSLSNDPALRIGQVHALGCQKSWSSHPQSVVVLYWTVAVVGFTPFALVHALVAVGVYEHSQLGRSTEGGSDEVV